jgi:hypothetical protein
MKILAQSLQHEVEAGVVQMRITPPHAFAYAARKGIAVDEGGAALADALLQNGGRHGPDDDEYED